jgi:CubicO group peptidase (beta-lactamase class C family)
MKVTTLAILAALIVAGACQDAATSGDQSTDSLIVKSRIDSTLKSFVDSGKIAGVSALIHVKGKEVYYNAFGNADREAGKPMDRNTIVRIFSMTKPVCGVALMTLYEKGMFQLDDSLGKYLPEFSNMKVFAGVDAKGKPILVPAKRPITVRDITRHTAGFAGYENPVLGNMVRKADAMNFKNTLSEFGKRLATVPLEFHPGDQWAYGVCVDVQAYLVEKLSGKPFDQYIQETIFNPLKMTNTWYLIPESERGRFAALYNRVDSSGALNRVPDSNANRLNTENWAMKTGGYGLASTLDDYMKFAQMLVNKGQLDSVRILKAGTVELMATNHLSDTISKRQWLPGKGRVGFGIDFAVRTQPAQSADENVGTVGEFFWDGAASTLFWVDPKNELTAVLFTQLVPFDKVKLHKKFRDAVYGPYKP